MDNEEKIPPFVQDYLNKMDYEGYADFVKITRDYHKAKEDYPGKFAEQSAHLNNFNRATGQNRQLNYQDGLDRIEADFRKSAYQAAQKHGYTGPDPNKPADKEFTKQGEKFQGMMDQAKQRQQNKAQQQEAEKAKTQQQEKQAAETLKSQQPYQQQKPNVEFKGVEQEQSGADQQSREQQRAAFLAKIKQTKDQQTQRQQNNQPEI